MRFFFTSVCCQSATGYVFSVSYFELVHELMVLRCVLLNRLPYYVFFLNAKEITLFVEC